MMASPLSAPSSRASTPDSPLAKASTHIDDLTVALSDFSRAHTPDPAIVCCCRRQDCEATSAWAGVRAKLENRLVLSAEVGQALLQRHEAYVRRQDEALSSQASSVFSDVDEVTSLHQQVDYLTKKLDTVTEENTLMESRLNEVVIKHEMLDVSSRSVVRELHEARATVSRLSAQNARSVGWEMRLGQATQERDDMRQERDSETHRTRVAESKAAAFVDKCAKLQSEVYTLREEVHNFRVSRAEFSKSVLHEARTRLEALQHSLGRDQREDPETTRVLESLVADNETLKRDIAELQNLLVEAREDVRSLREELEEHRASGPSFVDDVTKVGTPPPSTLYLPRSPVQGRPRGHHPSNSGASAAMLYGLPHAPKPHVASPHTPSAYTSHHRRSPSANARLVGNDAIAEWRDEQDETLLSPFRPRSPGDTLLMPDARRTSFTRAPRYSPSHHSGELDHESLLDGSSSSHERSRGNIEPFLLLTHSRGVQTDGQFGHYLPSPRPSTLGVDRDSSPGPEGRSDTSSISQQDTRTAGIVAALIDRVAGLLVRMTQADVKTLTNRLKRQHLAGGDVRHLSRSTISGICNEVVSLRAPGVSSKEDGVSPSLTVTRGDIKTLLKLFKDMFAELGALRGQINEVVFDPAVAHKLRKEATEPERPKGEQRTTSAMGGWIAPIQKLFTNPSPGLSTNADSSNAPAGANNKPAADLGRGRAPSRVVPKLAPAISATSTTVNVEFASSGVRKTDTSEGLRASSSPAGVPLGPARQVAGPTALRRPIAVPHASSRQLMGIFAGAPQSFTNPSPPAGEGWVVLPKNDKDRVRQLKGAASAAYLRGSNTRNGGVATIGRSSARNSARLPRNVDAVIDQQDEDVPDFRETLLERTLRPRGLSDSSIHTSFMQGEASQPPHDQTSDSGDNQPLHPGNRRGQTTGVSSPTATGSVPASPPQPFVVRRGERAQSPVARLGKNLASWATVATGGHFDDGVMDSDLLIGSPREDGVIHAAWARRGLEGRDF